MLPSRASLHSHLASPGLATQALVRASKTLILPRGGIYTAGTLYTTFSENYWRKIIGPVQQAILLNPIGFGLSANLRLACRSRKMLRLLPVYKELVR
jgi:hypothetical protein